MKVKETEKYKVVGYTRASRKSLATERQIIELTEKCANKNWEVVEMVSEVASGAKPYTSRKGFRKVLDLIEEGKVNLVMVHEISRLGRSTPDVANCIQELKRKGVSVYVGNEDLLLPADREDAIASLIIAILTNLAQHERELMVERIKSGIKRSNKKSGRKEGTRFGIDHYTKKYPNVIDLLGHGVSIAKVAKLQSVHYDTVKKINALLKEEQQRPLALIGVEEEA
ncbi:MAG: recombinase family protein [Crocinitomicaceae bacterium]|nr:recombinase family protein [Crocinitomicaceae bacterium]